MHFIMPSTMPSDKSQFLMFATENIEWDKNKTVDWDTKLLKINLDLYMKGTHMI